jgi:hypothetical protein
MDLHGEFYTKIEETHLDLEVIGTSARSHAAWTRDETGRS